MIKTNKSNSIKIWKRSTISYRMIEENLSDKMKAEQKPERSKGESHGSVVMWGGLGVEGVIPERGHHRYENQD